MKLEDLVEFWIMLIDSSEGNVVVTRDIAEKTLVALGRLDGIQDAITALNLVTEQTL